MIKIAIVGCHGIPAQYGGYETLVEYLADYKPVNVELLVYCNASEYAQKPKYYKGVRLKHIHLPSKGIMSSFYDMYTILLSIWRYDKILILGCNCGFILPLLFPFRNKFVLNIGGIEWQRSKYSPVMQKMVRLLMKAAVKNSGHLIADNEGIKDYIKAEYGRADAEVIAYGGDQAKTTPITSEAIASYPFLKNKYAVAIARIQPDNNVEMLLNTFQNAPFPLVYIGNWNVSDYAKNIRKKYSRFDNLILLDAIYDLNILNMIRSNCHLYIHAHSAGGTNPSLVEAMHLEVPVICYGNIFNRYVTEQQTLYFSNEDNLAYIVNNLNEQQQKTIAAKLKQIATNKYTWEIIAQQYYDFVINC
jgi:glycosyltransferase involved in cell wall biosynthesis